MNLFLTEFTRQGITCRLSSPPIMSGDISPFIGDADYFKKKLLSALGIPPAYLAEEQAASTRSLLSMEDINWSRSIKKYQKGFNDAIESLKTIQTNINIDEMRKSIKNEMQKQGKIKTDW